MSGPHHLVARLGGFARTSDLNAAGFTARDLAAAVTTGLLRRSRRGWYSTLPPHDRRYRAVSLGGRVTGAAALRLHGAWMWGDPPLAVSLPAHLGRTAVTLEGVRVHWDPREVQDRGGYGVVDLLDAYPHAVRAVAFDEAVALLDWGIRSGALDSVDLFRATDGVPRRSSGLPEWTDDGCQSFLESIVRTRMRQSGHRTRTQVRVEPGRFIDIVVDDVVAIEVDGREHHESTFESDRVKDLAITVEGRHCIRVSRTMIQSRWPEILAAVESALDMRRRSFAVRGLARRR